MSQHRALWLPPLMSAFLATAASGLYTTLTSLQLAHLQQSSLHDGLIFAVYFLGLSFGTLSAPNRLSKIGHQKTYLILCVCLILSLVFESLTNNVIAWASGRFLIGVCTGMSFVVYETWINHFSPSKHRAFLFGLYVSVYYASLACGQLFLPLSLAHSDWLYEIIIALTALSMLPIGLSDIPNEYQQTIAKFRLNLIRRVPLISQIGCLSSGVLTGAILSLLPYLMAKNAFSESQIALIMLCTLLSGTLPQLGIGYLNGKIQGKRMVAIICLITIVVALVERTESQWVSFVAFSVIIGSMVFSLYPVCIGYALPNFKAEEITSVNTILLFAYSLGTAIGPLLGSLWIGEIGSDGYYYLLCLFPGIVLLTCLCRKPQQPVAQCRDDK